MTRGCRSCTRAITRGLFCRYCFDMFWLGILTVTWAAQITVWLGLVPGGGCQ
jgi:hypothetical protein